MPLQELPRPTVAPPLNVIAKVFPKPEPVACAALTASFNCNF